MLSFKFSCQKFLNQFFRFFFSVLHTRYLKSTIFLLVACTLYIMPLNSYAAQVTLGWDKSADAVDGYIMHYGPSYSQTYSGDVGNSTSCTISGLQEGVTYYFAVTAYNDVEESDYSNVVTYTVPFD